MKLISNLNAAVMALAVLAVGNAWAADVDCFSRGVAHTILNDGSGTFPVVEAGEVFVSLTADATPVWTDGSYTSETATNFGSAASGKVKQDFYFWARAKEGYKFIGWNTSKTGKTAASGSDVEGAPYCKTYTHWSSGTADAPKEQVMYAIFEKLADADSEHADKGDGAVVTAIEGNEYVSGSTSKNFSVKVVFAEGLQFVDKTKAMEGYGVNPVLLPYVSCVGDDQTKVSVAKVSVNAAYKEGSYSEYEPAYGVIELPYTMAVGEYTVHLPYGLFNTQQAGVSASHDFKVTILSDDTPLLLVSHQPANDYSWNADPENELTDGESLMVTLNYNKVIASVNADKEITLSSASGKTYRPESCSIGMLNKSQGLVSFGKLPNGIYTFSMPADVFVGANGLGNETLSFAFSITGSKVDEWALPLYTDIVAMPSNNSQVRSLTQISISLNRDGYDAPIGILKDKGTVTASKLITTYPDNADDPEALPTVTSQAIEGVSASVKGGQLIISFATPFADEAKVLVNVPAGIVNNLAMPVATMTPQEIFEEGGCTNPAISLTFDVHPTAIKVTDVTGIGTVDHWEKDANGRDVRVDTYKSLINAQLVPTVNNGDEGDRVTYIYFWYPEEFASLNYAGGASITNITTQKPYNIAAIEFKTGGDAYHKNVIQMRLSTENFIYSDVYDQGEYEVVLPGGFAYTADGMTNEGITFRFTYGDPAKAYHPEDVNLDVYLGDYRNLMDEGETVSFVETFKFEKIDGQYCVTELCGSSLVIPVEANASGFVLKFTENEAGEAFMSYSGSDVVVNFAEQGGKPYIFIDQYALYSASGEPIVGGATYYEQYTPSAISSVSAPASAQIYNLSGQRTQKPQGLVIVRGKKIMRTNF